MLNYLILEQVQIGEALNGLSVKQSSPPLLEALSLHAEDLLSWESIQKTKAESFWFKNWEHQLRIFFTEESEQYASFFDVELQANIKIKTSRLNATEILCIWEIEQTDTFPAAGDFFRLQKSFFQLIKAQTTLLLFDFEDRIHNVWSNQETRNKDLSSLMGKNIQTFFKDEEAYQKVKSVAALLDEETARNTLDCPSPFEGEDWVRVYLVRLPATDESPSLLITRL